MTLEREYAIATSEECLDDTYREEARESAGV